MLKIRLQRTGRKREPTFRVVVVEKDEPVKGAFHEILGLYLPSREEPVLELKEERINHWISKGATPSDTVARLLKKQGFKDMDKFILQYTKQKKKKAVEEEPAAPAPAPDAPKEEEAPSEEPKEENAEEKPAEEEDGDNKKKEE